MSDPFHTPPHTSKGQRTTEHNDNNDDDDDDDNKIKHSTTTFDPRSNCNNKRIKIN